MSEFRIHCLGGRRSAQRSIPARGFLLPFPIPSRNYLFVTDSIGMADQGNAHYFLSWDARYFKEKDYPLLLRWYAKQGYIPNAQAKLAQVWKEAFLNTGSGNPRYLSILGKMRQAALTAKDKAQDKAKYRMAGVNSSPDKSRTTHAGRIQRNAGDEEDECAIAVAAHSAIPKLSDEERKNRQARAMANRVRKLDWSKLE